MDQPHRFQRRRVCSGFPAPPAGKAQILRTIRIDAYDLGSPDQYVTVFTGPNCTIAIASTVDVIEEGQIVIPFDPGVASRRGFSIMANNVSALAYADEYIVPAAQVPAAAAPAPRMVAAGKP